MDIEDIFDLYDLDVRARGYSDKTINHVKGSVRYFSQYLGGINDINKVTGDDFRRFLVALQERNTWEGLSFAKDKKLSATTINTYSMAIKSFWNWLKQKGIVVENPLESVPNPKKSKTIPKVYSEDDLRAVFQILPEGMNGFIVPVRSHDVLAARVVRLLTDHTIRQQFGRVNRQIIVERNNWGKEMGKMENFYQELIVKFKRTA